MTNEAIPYALGIDVSKAKLEAALLTPAGQLHAKSASNAPSGFEALLRWAEGLAGGTGSLRVCLEASGGYEQEAALFLHEAGVHVSMVNPRRTSAYAKSQLQRSKTDCTDAALLARFSKREEPSKWEPPTEEERALRQMTRGLESLKKERDRLNNQLGTATNEAVADSLRTVIRTIEKQIDGLKKQIDAHAQSCSKLARRRDLLETIPGVGKFTATLVLAELGEVSRFKSARQAAAYAGLVPSHHRSGSSVHRRSRLSKVGSSRLRKALYFPAITALRCNEAIQAFGDRLAERGKAKMVIIAAAMRKLLHICYGVLKNDQPFDASLHPGT